jgi:hypothetical protein
MIIEPRLGFTSDETTATAIVRLGGDVPADSILRLDWYRLTGVEGGREHLFGHDVAVGPGGRAFSVGLAPRGLAPGLYETVATLGVSQVRTPWVATAQASSGSPGSTLADWELPGPGEAGYVPDGDLPPTPAVTPATSCVIDRVGGGLSPMTELIATAEWRGPCADLVLTASLGGAPLTMAGHRNESASGAWGEQVGQADLCVGVAGGSDLPGTAIRIDVSGSGSGSGTYVLPDLGPALQAGVEAIPEAGSTVRAGDTIQLHGLALLLPPAHGVKVLYLDDGVDLIESVGNVAGTTEPVPCELGRYIGQVFAEYRVPDDPPNALEICAAAEGFDGTLARNCIRFPTEGSAFRLDGVWDDNGRRVRITQAGTSVSGEFIGDYYCDLERGSLHGEETPQPDANVQTTKDDFTGTLSGTEEVAAGDTITGEVVVCRWGGSAPGIARVRLELTVEDANTLRGEYIADIDYDEDGEMDRGPITMVRELEPSPQP